MTRTRRGRPNKLSDAQLGHLLHRITAEGVSVSQIARELGVDHSTIIFHRDRWLDGNRRKYCWTDEEIDALIEGLRAGSCVWSLSYRLQRPVGAIRCRLYALRQAGRIALDDEPISLIGICRFLGVTNQQGAGGSETRAKIKEWIAAGALQAEVGPGGRWSSSLHNLLDFLHDEKFWPEWNPFRLSDPEWRREFVQQRGLSGYLLLSDIVTRYGIPWSALDRACAKGHLPFVSLPLPGGSARYLHYLAVERHDWSNCHVPTRRGREYGRLFHPPQKRRYSVPLRRIA